MDRPVLVFPKEPSPEVLDPVDLPLEVSIGALFFTCKA